MNAEFVVAAAVPTEEEAISQVASTLQATEDAIVHGVGFIRLDYCTDGSIEWQRIDPADVMVKVKPEPHPVADFLREQGFDLTDFQDQFIRQFFDLSANDEVRYDGGFPAARHM